MRAAAASAVRGGNGLVLVTELDTQHDGLTVVVAQARQRMRVHGLGAERSLERRRVVGLDILGASRQRWGRRALPPVR
jgi:hypothetical protein